jgi:hypothetical protein
MVTQLPAYIIERNAQALAAGLTIERQQLKNGCLINGRKGTKLTTWFLGNEQQWMNSIFCQRSRPFGAAVTVGHFWCFSPTDSNGLAIALRRKADDSFRGAINELLPDDLEPRHGEHDGAFQRFMASLLPSAGTV